MKGAFLVAAVPDLFDRLVEALLQVAESSTVVADGAAQYVDESGRLFTLFASVTEDYLWEVRTGPFTLESGSEMPDLSTIYACPAECRWETLFAQLVSDLTAALDFPVWVIDGNGGVWLGSAVDPQRVQL